MHNVMAHQALRAALHSSMTFQQSPEGGYWFTRGTHEWLAAFTRDRHWGSISMKLAILGVGYLALQVRDAAPRAAAPRAAAPCISSHHVQLCPPPLAPPPCATALRHRFTPHLARQVLVMKVVVVFLSQLNLWLAPYPPAAVALAFAVVGTAIS